VNYRVLIDARAARQLESLPAEIVRRLDEAIQRLVGSPRPPGVKRLRGKYKDGWRIRVGKYRILYRIEDATCEVRIFEIGHRRDVYR
jgi:mRNA interferase RelE/StbE